MKKNGGYEAVAGLLLIFIFACAMFFTLSAGAGIYEDVSRSLESEYTSRTAVSYVAAKVHSCDTAGGVAIGTIGSENALILSESYYGVDYKTYIYCHDGYVRELFCAAGDSFKPEDGLEITKAELLDFSFNGKLLKIACTTDGTVTEQYVCLNAEGGGDR